MNLQEDQNTAEIKEVFISWTGRLGRALAIHLKDHMFNFSPLRGWVSDTDITAGAVWFTETQRALARAAFGVVCLTPGSSKRPWLNFETGFLFGQLENCKLINFGETLANPLMQLHRIDGTNQNDWVRLLREMTNRNQYECEQWVMGQFPHLEEKRRLIEQSPYSYMCQIDTTLATIQDAVDRLKANSYALQNICFQQVILHSYSEIRDRSLNVDSSYSVTASQYPQYLLFLQNELEPKPHVKAIAIINVEEQFWQQTMGRKILISSRDDSIRVFVFTSEKDFEITYPTLREHARQYKVYAMSFARLSEVLGSTYTKDFSIINALGNKLLAVYDDGVPEQKNICFIAEPKIITEYEKQFDRLLDLNVVVSIPNNVGKDTAEIEQFRRSIFKGLTPYKREIIEMSGYISVIDYDQHEEKHAYYKEMMERMIEICLEHHRKHRKTQIEVLEFGAGTGIFTMRLLTELSTVTKELSTVTKVDAIEIDWHCYHILRDKIKRYINSNRIQIGIARENSHLLNARLQLNQNPNDEIEINIYHEDSRTYNPPGQFDYIFSSFADHHIKRGDKEKYFDNVKRNLKADGLMIVGDEFIPEHDSDNREVRNSALRAYHNHIIEIAEQQGERILADLERAALESGLEEKGDFKISCTQYEKHLKVAGFQFTKERIGPLDRDDVGGVYVYTAKLST